MTNSKSPLIHVKAIKTNKYFQVDTTSDQWLLNLLQSNTAIGQIHASGSGKKLQSKKDLWKYDENLL